MDINSLVGFTLESCSFSKSSYTFEFCGKLNNEYRTFLVSTSYNFSVDVENMVDALENFSVEVWNFLEKEIKSISIERDARSQKIVFVFENEISFFIWSGEPLIDNMLIVTEPKTGEWYPVL